MTIGCLKGAEKRTDSVERKQGEADVRETVYSWEDLVRDAEFRGTDEAGGVRCMGYSGEGDKLVAPISDAQRDLSRSVGGKRYVVQ